MEINGISAVVTGGASGLGLATAQRLLERGAKVVVLDLPGSRGEQAVAELAAQTSGTVRFVPGDVRDEDTATAAVAQAAQLAPLRVTVNCAGTGNAIRTVKKDGTPFPQADFERIVSINLFGTFNVLRLAAANMAANDPIDGSRGVIVNTASIAAFEGQVGQAAYSASKGGVVGMTLPIARDLAVSGIRVVTIAPGLMRTPILGDLPPEALDAIGGVVPNPPRLGCPAEFGRLVESIVDNDYLNGEVIRLDGALRLGPK
ncbi:SDR family NAD(P)-dependent oxidoreductase [Actinocrispum sp. NPDC049592]|uniref:SDR family NAD(P)-dependent oxidoreductase n=1 Tax=Actinocrispum sp. NPDC049592 TaxID=3154835 RepID=UPI00341CB9BA